MTQQKKPPTNGPETAASEPTIGGEALKGRPSVRVKVIDRRFWARKHHSPDEIPADATAFDERQLRPAYVQELESQLQKTVAQLQTVANAYRHLREEQESFRRRMEKQRDHAVFEFKRRLFLKILDIMDNLRLAIDSARDVDDPRFRALLDGLQMVYTQIARLLETEGAEKIEPVGEIYDPGVAEVLEVVSVEDASLDHRVLEVVKPGYRLGDQLLRPALVRVGQVTNEAKSRKEEAQ